MENIFGANIWLAQEIEKKKGAYVNTVLQGGKKKNRRQRTKWARAKKKKEQEELKARPIK